MELMSSAFLFVLVALLPQTLGKTRAKNPGIYHQETKFNSSVIIRKKSMLQKGILLNVNSPPLVSNSSALQAVYNDIACRTCKNCMGRAIKAHSAYVHKYNNRPSAEELREDVLTNEVNVRAKRDMLLRSESTTENPSKKGKPKRGRIHKSVTVTKYNVDNEVYALKVKEIQVLTDSSDDKTMGMSCQVFSVKKSYPCDSTEGNALLLAAKRKANKKRNKKEQDKTVSSTTETLTHTSVFRKREVYNNLQEPENFMPSIEDIY